MPVHADSLLWVIVVSAALALWKFTRGYILASPLDKMPGPPSDSFLKGNLLRAHVRDSWRFLDHLTNDYGQVVRLTGFCGARVLWVFDPKALQHVVLKDQDVYEEGPSAITMRNMALGPGLLSTLGDHHRRQKKLLNPVFSIAHMRQMTPLFNEVVGRLRVGISDQLKTSSTNEVEMMSWLSRTALELIGQGALGHSFDRLVEYTPNVYGEALKALVPTIGRVPVYRLLSPYLNPVIRLQNSVPVLKRLINVCLQQFPDPNVRKLKAIVDTMDATSRMIYQQKRDALAAGEVGLRLKVEEGRDLMSVLLRANMMAAEDDRLPDEEIIAQISTLTTAGTDTTSNAIARTLHVLATRPEVQERVRVEVLRAQSASGGHDLEYDDLVELPYLDAVCRETLRLYPPVPFQFREAKTDITLPLSAPMTLTDGITTSSLYVPKGTMVLIGIYSSNRNKAIWGKDAEEWNPERWMDGKMPSTVVDARIPGVYSNLMTFLGGGRACIGFKFSQLEMKVVLAALLSSFRFSLATGEKANIVWNRSGVAWPSVGPEGTHPSMPLAVEALSA